MPTLTVRTVATCPACDSPISTIIATLDSERRSRFLAYSRMKYGGMLDDLLERVQPAISRCQECGHCWYRQQPDASELNRMYAAARPLNPGQQPSRTASLPMMKEMLRLHKLADRRDSNVALLDYGSGYGRWARAAVAAGFDVTAFEPSMERGRESPSNFKVVHSLDDLRGQRFSVVQLEQVLEHVPDPLATLRGLHEHCHRDAIVRITVPNLLRAHEGNALWSSWPFDGAVTHTMAPYEHLHGFTPRSLDRLIQRSGFRPIRLSQLLRHRPSIVVRDLLGAMFPSLGGTLRLVTPASSVPTAPVSLA